MVRMFSRLAGGLIGLLFSILALAQPVDWQQIQQQAKGQTVWFNAWGGDKSVNYYLAWVSGEMARHYDITVKIVPINDAADSVKRIRAEAAAGRRENGGTVDLLWINGENFRALKQDNLLLTGWATGLPNWRYVDTAKPVTEDFAIPTEGSESPWGSAQLTFITAPQGIKHPITTPQALLEYAQQHPGRLSYPRPPDFTGTAFVEQLLLSLTPDRAALAVAPDPATFKQVTAPLWDYLDKLHPLLWRQGKDFPPSTARLDQMLANNTLHWSMTFNPAHAARLVSQKQLPAGSDTFGFHGGMVGNVHFVAIPANARAKAAAQVVANFLLSPQAQIHKADPAVWGDPSVLAASALPAPWQGQLAALSPAPNVPVLPEPHSAWVNALEHAWLQRYGN